MNQELSKELMCILMRSGVEIWMEKEKLDIITNQLEGTKRFINVDGNIINSVDISGIFKVEEMEDNKRRKNGQWKCKEGTWHDRFEKCDCKINIPSYARDWSK